MNLLDENNFIENRNGRVIESQLSALKKKTNIWFDLLLFAVVSAVVGFILMLGDEVPWIFIPVIVSGATLVWLSFRFPALKYYFLVLPDARENNIAHTTAKLDYRNGYILQGKDVRLSLFDGKTTGLIAGNVYDVFYLPRAKVVISAKAQQSIGESQQAHEFTLLFGKALGFVEEHLAANRNGAFPFAQRLKILKETLTFILAVGVMFPVTLLLVYPASGLVSIDDVIIFTLRFVFLLIFLLVMVISSSPFQAKGAVAALLGRKIEQVEGVGHISCLTFGAGSARRNHYFLQISRIISLEIHKRVYDVLVDGLYYRVFYASHTKHLLGVEVLKVRGQTIQNA